MAFLSLPSWGIQSSGKKKGVKTAGQVQVIRDGGSLWGGQEGVL